MKVTIEYIDNDAFTVEEIVKQATDNYGKLSSIKVLPDSTNAHDLIYFGIQQIITHEQLGLLFDDKFTYPDKIAALRRETLYKLQEIVNQVIIDNEAKVA